MRRDSSSSQPMKTPFRAGGKRLDDIETKYAGSEWLSVLSHSRTGYSIANPVCFLMDNSSSNTENYKIAICYEYNFLCDKLAIQISVTQLCWSPSAAASSGRRATTRYSAYSSKYSTSAVIRSESSASSESTTMNGSDS